MKRQRLDRAINARVINFPDANNHLTGLLTEYLTRSLGLPGDPPGTNTVIGLLKSGLGDLIVLAGLKEWLQEQVDAGILEAANQAQFNQWVKDHIGQTEQDIDTIDSTLDTINRWVDRASKVISIIAKAVKAIKDILSIFGFIEIPQGTTPQYDYNSNFDPDDPDELEEFVNALIEILSNGWLKPKFYTKAEITALLNDYLTQSAASTNYYTKIQVDAYLTTLATEKANSSDVYTKSETNTLLAAKADASNTYTKTETDTLLNNKVSLYTLNAFHYTKTQTDTLLNNKVSISSLYVYSTLNVIFRNVTFYWRYKDYNGDWQSWPSLANYCQIIKKDNGIDPDDVYISGRVSIPGISTVNPSQSSNCELELQKIGFGDTQEFYYIPDDINYTFMAPSVRCTTDSRIPETIIIGNDGTKNNSTNTLKTRRTMGNGIEYTVFNLSISKWILFLSGCRFQKINS